MRGHNKAPHKVDEEYVDDGHDDYNDITNHNEITTHRRVKKKEE